MHRDVEIIKISTYWCELVKAKCVFNICLFKIAQTSVTILATVHAHLAVSGIDSCQQHVIACTHMGFDLAFSTMNSTS